MILQQWSLSLKYEMAEDTFLERTFLAAIKSNSFLNHKENTTLLFLWRRLGKATKAQSWEIC